METRAGRSVRLAIFNHQFSTYNVAMLDLSQKKIIIGMVHVAALPGSPTYSREKGALDEVRSRVVGDVRALTAGGVDALMLENFGDAPFFPGRVPAETVACMTSLAATLRQETDLPFGINVLRNDGQSALAVAIASGASFIRVNVLCGARVTDQGILQGIAHDLLRDRNRLSADHVSILADVNVKHSAPLGIRPMEEEVHDVLQRGGADGVIVSGSQTGRAVDADELERVRKAAKGSPVLLGSGVTADTLTALWPHANGFIVGSALKKAGRAVNHVDADRVKLFMDAVNRLR